MQSHHIKERSDSLKQMALLLEAQIVPFLTGSNPGDLAGFVTARGRATGTRITVIDAAGNVLADSQREPRDMENHLFRPEIQASLRGETQMSIRPSSTLGADMMYLSVPLKSDGRVVGALRMSTFMKDFQVLMSDLRTDLLKVLAVATGLALLVAFFLTRSVAAPTRQVIEALSKVAAGDLDVSVPTRRAGAFQALGGGFNTMIGRLNSMFGEIRLQNEEIRSILASVSEGLCVVDGKARILICNDAFQRLAGHGTPEGSHFWEVLRSSAASEAVRQAKETGQETISKAVIRGDSFAVKVTPLTEGGCLIVTLSAEAPSSPGSKAA
jgi:two-component system phosphate regulon sensor histidine kinase PhoR